ncbi:putative mechanosensitive ion channel protein [Methanobrevibacter arboriphilus JCM 13429 = DSM 1125]|uniref:Putative mechanosensitive ion channel protein n=2 Tax=Methanobrevibacter arboriphilus TaxID=39441 RepID=A0A1V6N1X4_METAZ|nr:putative mechanosensitive ion channel protein [Methanobrevibacter arboriphilus JCM 13429 = DSM 1125]
MRDKMNLNIFPQYPFIGLFIYIVIILIATLLAVKISSFLINRVTKKFEIELTFNYLLKDLVKYSIYIIAFLMILEVVGVDINALIVSVGVVGITLGFAARDVISSFVSGIFILADKTVKVGEVIEVDNIKGKVTKMGFRTTTIVTPDNLIVTIPNTVLAKNPYINYTFFDKYRIDLEVIIPFNIDINNFERVLVQRISNLNWVLIDSSAKVDVVEMNENGVKVKISAWGENYSRIDCYRLDLANEVRKLIGEMD